MIPYSYRRGKERYIRVTRPIARKVYNKGLQVGLCASNMRPDSPWGVTSYIDNSADDTFEKYETVFRFYNCNAETGRRISYYVREVDLE